MTARGFVPVVHGATDDRPDETDTRRAAEAVCRSLIALGFAGEIVHVGADLGALPALAARRPLALFNLVEALGGDAAAAPRAARALERLGLVYTGASAAALEATLSKTASKRRLVGRGLPTPRWSEDGSGFAADQRVIVKSDSEHASFGIDAGSLVEGAAARTEIERRQSAYGGRFFAELFVEGREFNLALLERAGGVEVLPPAEIEFVGYGPDRPRIVDYDAKWREDSFAYNNTPRRFRFPPSDDALLLALRLLALAAWRLFGLSGYARIDFRVDAAGRPWILEVNSNPCLTPDAGFVAAVAQAGVGYDRLVERILQAALDRRREAA